MTLVRQVYYCAHCGNTVQVIGEGEGVLICCGSKMKLLEEQKTQNRADPHFITIPKEKNGIQVQIGTPFHPMEETHYISWIEVFADGISYQHFLDLKEKPEVFFPIKSQNFEVRAVCNRHGLWSMNEIC